VSDDQHRGVFFLGNHRASAFEVASAIMEVAETYPNRDHLRGVVYLDDWL